jgi:bifunctional DNA-binding transcriptional regulator/antitoxin component of YhaV-PrlF toxin-antitoxin module
MVRQLSQRKTITIPSDVLKKTGSNPGDFFEILSDGQKIILIPKLIEDKFDDIEWEKLKKLANEKGFVYNEAKDALNHLKGLRNEV